MLCEHCFNQKLASVRFLEKLPVEGETVLIPGGNTSCFSFVHLENNRLKKDPIILPGVTMRISSFAAFRLESEI